MRGFGADASVSGGAPCLGIETRNTKPSVGTSRRRLSDLKFRSVVVRCATGVQQWRHGIMCTLAV